MPLKWLILGAFVAGFTIANIVSATRNNTTSGCSFLNSNNPAANANAADNNSGRDQPGDTTSNSNGAAADNANGSDASANDNSAPANSNGDSSGTNQNANSGDDGGGNDNSAPANDNSGGNQSNGNTASNTNENASENANENADDTSPAITGRYAGTLRRENAQSLGGDLPPPRVTSSSQAMEFAENFRPFVIMVINYAGAPDRPLTSVQQGDRQTLTATLGAKQITMDVTVREASYQRRQMRAVLDIAYRATSGNLSESGTGEQIIECALDASGNLTVSSGVHYEVRLTAGAIIFNTIEETSMTGTLNRE